MPLTDVNTTQRFSDFKTIMPASQDDAAMLDHVNTMTASTSTGLDNADSGIQEQLDSGDGELVSRDMLARTIGAIDACLTKIKGFSEEHADTESLPGLDDDGSEIPTDLEVCPSPTPPVLEDSPSKLPVPEVPTGLDVSPDTPKAGLPKPMAAKPKAASKSKASKASKKKTSAATCKKKASPKKATPKKAPSKNKTGKGKNNKGNGLKKPRKVPNTAPPKKSALEKKMHSVPRSELS